MADPRQVEGIPEPLDGDDDDVAWALQTAAVEWRRAAYGDAITWLRRASSAAMEAGHAPRAAFLEAAAARLATSSGPARPGEGRPQGSATEVVVEVDDDDGLETIEGLDALGEAGAEGRGRVPGLPPLPLPPPPVPPVPGVAGRLPPLPPPPSRPLPPVAPPPPGLGRRATPAPHRVSSAAPAGRGSVLRSIAHPEERERQHEVLPPQPGGHDSGSGLPPSNETGSYLPGVLGVGAAPGGRALPAPAGSRDARGRMERTPAARPPSEVPSARRSQRPPERLGSQRGRGASDGIRSSEIPAVAPASARPRLPASDRPQPKLEARHGEDAQAGRPGAVHERAAYRRSPADRRVPTPDAASARQEPVPAAPVIPLPELPAQHPEAEAQSERAVDPEVVLPLVHEGTDAAAGDRRGESESDRTLPEPSAPEPSPESSLDARETAEQVEEDGGSAPDLPDIDAEVIASATASLIPDAPRFDDEEESEELPDASAGATGEGAPPEPADPSVLGVHLSSVRGLQDLSTESQQVLARRAKLEVLQPEEEISSFAVALVVKGDVGIVPAVSDIPCGYAQKGDVIFTRGSLAGGIALSVVAGPDGAAVATWDQAALDVALSDSPWVGDELLEVADRFQAMAGATMGPLGQRLDESLMASVFAKAEVRLLFAGDLLVEAGHPVQGLSVVGAGRIEIVGADGKLQELHPGDLVFPSATPASDPAPASARAGAGGALVLQVGRHETHELLVSVPPLLEVLATA